MAFGPRGYGLVAVIIVLGGCAGDPTRLAAVTLEEPAPSTPKKYTAQPHYQSWRTEVTASINDPEERNEPGEVISAVARTNPFCIATHAEASADSKILLAPSLQASYSSLPDPSQPLSTGERGWVGLEITPSNLFVANALRRRADARCRLEIAQDALLRIADDLTPLSRAAAYKAKADVLAERLVRAQKIQNRFALALRTGASTVDEKHGVDRAVLELGAALGESRRIAAIERAKVSRHEQYKLAQLLSEIYRAERDAAHAENDLRRSRAFTTSLYAQSVMSDDHSSGDARLGIKASYSLGSLFTGSEERTIVEASSAYAMERVRGAPQVLLMLSRTISVERQEARSALALLRAEQDKFTAKILELEGVATERSQRLTDLIRLRLYALEADASYNASLEVELTKLSNVLAEARG